MKNFTKRGLALCLLCLFSCTCSKTATAKELIWEKKEIPYYQYEIDNQKYNLELYYEKDSKIPLFSLKGDEDIPISTHYEETTDLTPLNQGGYYFVRNICYLASKENDLEKQIAAQFYLYKLDAMYNQKKFTYLFDPTKIEKLIKQLEDESISLLNAHNYDLAIYQGKWQTITDKDLLLPDYKLENRSMEIDIKDQIATSFQIKGDTLGQYRLSVDSPSLNSVEHLYKSSTTPYLVQVTKPKLGMINLNVHVIPEPPTYKITNSLSEGINMTIPKEAKVGEKVSFRYTLEKGYTLEYIKVFTEEHQEILMENQSFIMPESNVYFEVKTKKINYHLQVQGDHVKVTIPSTACLGDIIKLNPVISADYELISTEVITTNGKKLAINNQSFIMPDEDVTIIYQTKKKKYQVTSNSSKDVAIKPIVDQESGSIVHLEYIVNKPYQLQEVLVTTSSGQNVPVKNNEFIMPKENVIITLNFIKKALHQIKVISDEHVKVTVPTEAYYKDVIEIKVDVDKQYTISYAMANTEELKDLSFIMPDEDVVIKVGTIKDDESEEEYEEDEYNMHIYEEKDVYFEDIPNTSRNSMSSLWFVSLLWIGYFVKKRLG